MRKFVKLKVPERCHPLVRRLFEEMNKQQIGLLDLAERSGVNKNTIHDWKTRSMPHLHNIEACYTVLGLRFTLANIE